MLTWLSIYSRQVRSTGYFAFRQGQVSADCNSISTTRFAAHIEDNGSTNLSRAIYVGACRLIVRAACNLHLLSESGVSLQICMAESGNYIIISCIGIGIEVSL
jgi:hypothetical protein